MTEPEVNSTGLEMVRARLPGRDSVLPVLAVISFMVYGWTLVVYIWKVPSWIMFLTPGEVLVILAYSLTSAFLESLFVLGILLLASLLMPEDWMRDVFITRGTTAAIFGLGSVMIFMYRFSLTGYGFISNLVPWSLAGFGITLLMTHLATHYRWVTRFTAFISDRMLVFLYPFIPASLVSMAVVLYRNLF